MLEGGAGASLAGVALIALVLGQSLGQPGSLFVAIAPVFWGLGLALLASGVRGLPQYGREAAILAAVAATPLIETFALDLLGVDLAPLTARSTALLLSLGGWQASSRDVLVGLPGAWVVVSQGCSGLKTMYFLSGFAVVVLLFLPLPGLGRKLAVLVGAAAIGFLVNALRIALLALLATPEHREAFVFWHIREGAMLFEIVAVFAFLLFFYSLMPRQPAPVQTEESSRT